MGTTADLITVMIKEIKINYFIGVTYTTRHVYERENNVPTTTHLGLITCVYLKKQNICLYHEVCCCLYDLILSVVKTVVNEDVSYIISMRLVSQKYLCANFKQNEVVLHIGTEK